MHGYFPWPSTFFVTFAVTLVVSAVFLLWAGRILKIPGRSFGRALAIVVLGAAGTYVFAIFGGFIVGPRGLMGGVIAFLIIVLITVPLFRTTFLKALAANALAMFLTLLAYNVLSRLIFVAMRFLGQA